MVFVRSRRIIGQPPWTYGNYFGQKNRRKAGHKYIFRLSLLIQFKSVHHCVYTFCPYLILQTDLHQIYSRNRQTGTFLSIASSSQEFSKISSLLCFTKQMYNEHVSLSLLNLALHIQVVYV